MRNKRDSRQRRARRARLKIRELRMHRLSVFRSSKHMYAQIIDPKAERVLAQASTLEKDIGVEATSNIGAATKVGERIATRAKEAGVAKVAFDRSGYKYHGRVKALAEAARAGGLEF